MKKLFILTISSIFCLMIFSSTLCSQEITVNEKGDIIQKTPKGDINWSECTISAIGYASPEQSVYEQRVAAAADARANLLMVLGQVNIKRGITVEKGKLTGDINIQMVQGVLQNSFVSEPVQRGGLMSVIASKTLSPEILKEILPDKYFKADPDERTYKYEVSTTTSPESKATLLPESKPTPQSTAVVQPIPHTGLIVDASTLGVIPSLGFQILVMDTKEILYGLSTVDRMKVIDHKGMAGYTRSVEQAKKMARAGNNPLIIKASTVSGERSADIFVSKENAANIYKANLEGGFLKNLDVVIVCGS